MARRAARKLAWTAPLILLVSLSAAAQDTDPRPALGIDAEARQVLDDFATYCRSLHAFRVTIEMRASSALLGQNAEQTSAALHLAARRPNKISIRYTTANEAESTALTFRSDGVNCLGTMRDERASSLVHRYRLEPAPEDWNELACNQFAATALMMATVVPVTQAMLCDDPVAELVSGINGVDRHVTYAGRETLDGIECHVLRSVADATTQTAGKDFDWQLWIAVGHRPLVRQSKLTPGGITAKFLAINILATYKDWQTNQPIADEAFAVARPEGATQTSSFKEALTGKPAAEKPVAAPHPLVGKAAPPVRLTLLAGGTFDLAQCQCQGQSIVILDFWSTDCIACIQSLPVVEGVAREFADRGVQLYAVNLGQSADDARTFLENVKWSGQIPVLLDHEKEVAEAYAVSAMPHLAIVDKQGRVRVVHVGKTKNLAARLRAELAALVDGQELPSD